MPSATAEAGADLIGVVVGEPGVLAEAINNDAARAILAAIRPRARGVALSLLQIIATKDCAMVDMVQPDIVHVAARNRTRGLCLAAHTRGARAPAPAIAVRAGETVADAEAHQESVDYLMLESGAKGLPFAGGETHDWLVSRIIVERSRIPVILAGGLSADNVEKAIAAVKPWVSIRLLIPIYLGNAAGRTPRGSVPSSPALYAASPPHSSRPPQGNSATNQSQP